AHGPVTGPVVDEEFLQHHVVEGADPPLVYLLAHRAGDFGRDILDGIAPTRPLMARRRLRFNAAITGEERRAPGHEFLDTSTGFSGQSPHHRLMVHV